MAVVLSRNIQQLEKQSKNSKILLLHFIDLILEISALAKKSQAAVPALISLRLLCQWQAPSDSVSFFDDSPAAFILTHLTTKIRCRVLPYTCLFWWVFKTIRFVSSSWLIHGGLNGFELLVLMVGKALNSYEWVVISRWQVISN